LLELSDGEGETCEQVERMATDRLTQVRNKMADLVLMEGVLDGMVKECRLGKTPQCPLIETLFTSEQAQKS
jgi:MerR family mercuric resistance operon transcriptional regulator